MSSEERKKEIEELLKDEKSEMKITAEGPWGKYYYMHEVGLFEHIASCSPETYFEATIDGENSYFDSKIVAVKKGTDLHITAKYGDGNREENYRAVYDSKVKKYKKEYSQYYKRSCCVVGFEDGKSYKYNCSMDIDIGDKVFVGGAKQGQVGIVKQIIGEWVKNPYMQEIIERLEPECCKKAIDNIETKVITQIDERKNWNYYVNSKGTITIRSTKARVKKLVVPQKIDGKSVTEIEDECFSFNGSFEEIVIANTVRTLGRRLFVECKNLKKVVLGNGIKKIDSYVFDRCNAEEIVLPHGLQTIDMRAFYNCPQLKIINIPVTVKRIGYEAFYKCTALQIQVFPEEITYLDSKFSYGCPNINFTMEDGLTYMPTEKNPYYYLCKAKSKSEIKINKDCKVISEEFLYKNEKVTKVIIPGNVNFIGRDAFVKCNNLETVTFEEDDRIVKIHLTAFDRSKKLKFVGKAGGEIERYAIKKKIKFEEI